MATTDVEIVASDRTEFGKGASRTYRRAGQVPAVMYGSGSELRHVVLPAHQLNLALRIPRVVLDVDLGAQRLLVAPRDVQRDPVKTHLLHVDLILLSDAEVAVRHAYADALAKAESLAQEAGLDTHLAGSIIEEASENGEDLSVVADNIVDLLTEREKAMREAAAAEAAREEEAEQAASLPGGDEEEQEGEAEQE